MLQNTHRAVAFEKMWQPLNVNSRQPQTESKLSVISSLLFLLFAHNNTTLLFLYPLCIHFVKMMSQSSRLYPAMQVAYVLSYGHEYTLSINISLTTA